MRRFRLRLAPALCLAAALPWCGAMAQELYKSVGPDGRVVYSDRPPADGRVEKTLRFENLPASTLPAPLEAELDALRPAPSAPAAPRAGAAARPTGPAVLYSAAWCVYCRQAKADLARRGVAYREIDIDTASGKAAFAREGRGGIPLIVAGEQRVRGYSKEAYDALFTAPRR